MEAKGWIMLKVLINRYNPKAGESLTKFLPKEELAILNSYPIHSHDLQPLLQTQQALENMHYSWILPSLTKFSKPIRPFVIAALTPEQQAGLGQKSREWTISSPIKKFFLNCLYHELKIDTHLPLPYLSETDLSLLGYWTKKEIVRLIDFLGIHDLASEVRRIVNQAHLKNLYSCLSDKELYYLKRCLHQKERLVSPKLGIDPSKENCQGLRAILHRRGLIRLGKALAGQQADLIWYIAHRLDIGRGKLLLQYYQTQPIANVTQILNQQVLNVINFIKKSKM
jgi:hypothetical protein